MQPDVALDVVALILHFRDEGCTAACITSLVGDGIDKVVVVDNSEDAGRSLARLRGHLAPLLQAGLALEVSEPGRNLGFAAGVNLGLQIVRRHFGATHTLLINNDAVVTTGACQALLQAASRAGSHALVAPTLSTPIGNFSSLAYYQPYLALITRRPLPGSLPHLGGCCLLLPPVLSQPPLLDEDFFFYGEDFELGARSARKGIALIAADHVAVSHRMSVGSRNGSLFYEYHMARAHLLVVGKLAGTGPERMLMWMGRLVTMPARALLRTLRHRSTNPVRGLLMAAVDVARHRRRDLTPPAP